MRASWDQRVRLAAALLILGGPAFAASDARALTAIEIEVESTQSEPALVSVAGTSTEAPSETAPRAKPGADERVLIREHPVTVLTGPDPLFDDEIFDEQQDVYDPLEGMNRVFFGFNQYLDSFVWTPITNVYKWMVPEPGRRAVRRAFLNLGSAPIFVNDLLQLRFRDAGETLGRFVLNSTVGMAGFFDAAIEAGWEHHHSDFGQTLAMVGVGKGPYLVLPVLGPTTTRDGFGVIVDRAFEPLTYVFGFGLLGPTIQILIGAGNGVATRDVYVESMTALEESSVDFYAALRSVYVQTREAEIWAHKNRRDGTPPRDLEIDEEGPQEVEVLDIDDACLQRPIGTLRVEVAFAP
jgi:phospholipid-binding lipoprotein MlaA